MALFPELVTRNLSLKLAALGLAVLLWSVVRADEPVRTQFDVPVDVIVDDPGWTLVAPPKPATVTVVFSGRYRELVRLAGETKRLIVSVEEVNDSVQMQDLDARMVRVGGHVENDFVAEVRPSRLELHFERVETALRPVAVRVLGELPPGVRLSGPIGTDPSMVRVSGPHSRLAAIDSLPLQPIDLAALMSPETLNVHLDTTLTEGVLVSPRRVTVTVPAELQPDSLITPDSVPQDTVRPDTAHARAERRGAPRPTR